MPGSSVQSSQRAAAIESLAPLSYTVWPVVSPRSWRDLPPWLVLAAAGLGVTQSPRLAAISATVMVLATWRYFVPNRYALDSAGIHRHALGIHRLIRWVAVRRVVRQPTSLLVFVTRESGPLEVLSSTCIPLSDRESDILAWFERFAPAALARRPAPITPQV